MKFFLVFLLIYSFLNADSWVKPHNVISQYTFGDSSRVTLSEATSICSALGARIPTVKEFKTLAKKCGGNKFSPSGYSPNRVKYRNNIENKGFYLVDYWTSSDDPDGYSTQQAIFSFIGGGEVKGRSKTDGYFVYCIK